MSTLSTVRYLPANDQRQKTRSVGQFDGHTSDALPPSTNNEPVAQPGTVFQFAGGAAGNARTHRQVPLNMKTFRFNFASVLIKVV